jgi:hypothetical protein
MKELRLILLLTVCLAALFFILNGRNAVGGYGQWDFRAHYYSARAFAAGLDPYSNADVNRLNTTPYPVPGGHTYPYHPYTLPYFQLFTFLPYATATVVYTLYNVLLTLLLVALWQKFFLRERVSILAFTVCLLFSFNGSLLLGLAAGNPAVLEAAILWGAMLCFIKDRPLGFLLLITLISFFKGTPIILAPLVLLLPGGLKNIKLLAWVLLPALLVWLSPLLFLPKLFSEFWAYSSAVRETGIINPCSYAFISEILAGWPWLVKIVYFIWIIAVVSVYLMIIRKLDRRTERIGIVFLSLLTYALIVPRFKDYAYIQLLPISYFLITRNLGLLFFNLFGLVSGGLRLPYLVQQYHPFFAAVVNWAVLAALIVKLDLEQAKKLLDLIKHSGVSYISTNNKNRG